MKLFRKAIRQRRLTRMRELLSAVIEQNGSENQLPEDGRIIRSWAFVILGFVLFYVFTNADILLPAAGLIFMGLFYPIFLIWGILVGIGTLLLVFGLIYLFHRLIIDSYYQEFGMLYELATEELSVYKQEPLIPMSEEAERLQYYMEELKLETNTNKSKSGK
ncbi:hypothetical protein O3793_02725 [Granulicatella sp. 20925_1_28]|uniref:hypothetical protein n=1 Tax=Granulicatella sp. 20925_1_28 TaxID=3003686 RepID=UPI00352E54EA